MSDLPTTRPSVLFVCIHNAGRSQIAAAWVQHLSGGAVEDARPAAPRPGRMLRPLSRQRCSRRAST